MSKLRVCCCCKAWKQLVGFGGEIDNTGDGRVGECRKKSPTVGRGWPKTTAADWCLDFVDHEVDPNADIRPWQQIGEVAPEESPGKASRILEWLRQAVRGDLARVHIEHVASAFSVLQGGELSRADLG